MITLLRVVASFAIVGVLLWLFMRASNGRLGALVTGSTRGRAHDPLAVIERRQLTRSAGIAIVRAGERHLLVGISDQGVQLLAEGDDLAVEHDAVGVTHGDTADLSRPAVVHNNDVVSDRRLPTTDSGHTGRRSDLPNARTRLGRAATPRTPRMSFLSALRESTVRRT